jgi:heterodisulfide reductase subunit C2
MAEAPAIRPDSKFLKKVASEVDPKVSHCFQCKKCTNGCPITFAMDLMPNQVMRMILLGQKDELLKSKTIWVCASCQTCTTRCPNDIDIAHVMDGMRRACRAEGVKPAVDAVPKFHDSFLEAIKSRGRIHELSMVMRYKLKTRDFFSDQKLGMEMFMRGKMKLLGHTIRGKDEVKRIFDRAKD